ncbi:hypothetical protein HJC23_010972 [Cyclotella cryptica]|uniref:Methyltransferase domain-containing protein n=1 Tax=Cyclotella cryptica TaxID=29204 RepID=A0ABD3PZA8_9STRA|eukprot:CCRYP_010253-RA/>CCRYP_010253-RA protein AED:0.02 eAED:0.02 QI:50/1/1/1/1/1/3/2023/356
MAINNRRTSSHLLSNPIKNLLVLSVLGIAALSTSQVLFFHNNSQGTTVQSALRYPNRITDSPTDPNALARSQSFGFFDDITEERWMLHQKIYREYTKHKTPDQPLQYNPAVETRKEHWWNSAEAWYQNNYEPSFTCEFERRVYFPNMNGDGGKWVCDPHRIARRAAARKLKDPNSIGCVIYSVGSRGDFGFELGLQKEVGEGVCQFHIFDMGGFGSELPSELKNASYHQWGLKKQNKNVGEPKEGAEYYGLLDTIKLLGHENIDMIDVFKIDCEKCEWETFTDWFSDGVPTLHQILVETHGAPGQKALDFFDGLESEGYLIFHKEPNIQFGPNCLEYAFVKVDKAFMEGKTTLASG